MRLLFEGDWVKPCLLLALMCGCVAIGAAAYLSRSTRLHHFTAWTLALGFYCVYLVGCLGLSEAKSSTVLNATRYACIGLTSLLVFWACFSASSHARRWRELGAGVAGIVVWSVAAVLLVQEEFWIALPIFGLLSWANAYMAWAYVRRRKSNRGSILAAIGFLMWATHSLSFPFLVELPLSHALGYVFWALAALAIAVGMVVEQEIANSEAKYRTFFDSSNEAIFLVSPGTRTVLDVNTAAQRLSGRDAPALIGMSMLELCPELGKERNGSTDAYRLFGAVFRPYSHFAVLRPNGQEIICEGEMRQSHHEGREAIQLNIREVSQNTKVSQQMRRAEKLSSLGQLVAGVAHELNNPLAIVMGCTQLLVRRKDLDEKTHSEIKKVLRESERAAKIVRNLLAFVRPAEPQLTAVDMNQLVNNVLEPRLRELAEINIRLDKRLAANLPLTKADPNQIEQVLTNLVSNAMQAMESTKRAGVLTIVTEDNGFNIRITVGDTGPGVPKEIATRIFDPFFTTKPPGKGTGLGLTISNGIIEEHKGKIWVEGDVGKGARFIVELPIVAPEAKKQETPAATPVAVPVAASLVPSVEPVSVAPEPVVAAATAAPAPVPAKPVPTDSSFSDRRLLLVDDEPHIVGVMSDVFTGLGYQVETACNGADALNRVLKGRFDLIISDMMMPEMDGRKLYESLREKKPEMAGRIIFVTGDTVSHSSRAFLETTGTNWLSKPFSIAEVEELVSSYFRDGAKPVVATAGAA